MKRFKDHVRRDCDLYMQGCIREKGETGEGKYLAKTEGVDADVNTTSPKRPRDRIPKTSVRPVQQSTIRP